MARAVPLHRFPLVASNDVDTVISTLNERAGGERRCISAPPQKQVSTFNFLRLGQAAVVSHAMGAMSVTCAGDLPGSFYLCRESRLTVDIGRQSHELHAGQLLCVLPGSDRTIRFQEDFSSLAVRINEAALREAMRLLGFDTITGWSAITAVMDEQSPTAEKFCRHLRETVRMYDANENFPDRRIDELMGRSLTFAAAEMIGSMSAGAVRFDGPSFEVAEAAERIISERFASPLTTSEIAQAVGQTIPCVKASLLHYTGLLPNELLTLVRLIAADEYIRRSYGDPVFVAQVCGFVTEDRYLAALARRDRLSGLLKRRTTGRGGAGVP